MRGFVTIAPAVLALGAILWLTPSPAGAKEHAASPARSSQVHKAVPATAPSRLPPPHFAPVHVESTSPIAAAQSAYVTTSHLVESDVPAPVAVVPAEAPPVEASNHPTISRVRNPSGAHLLLGAEAFLLQDKVAAGLKFGGEFRRVGLTFGFAPMYLTEDDPNQLIPGRHIGLIWSIHLQYLVRAGMFDIRPGIGVDVFDLWHRLGAEAGMPLLLSMRLNTLEHIGPFIEARYYLLRADGLGVNRTPGSSGNAPFLFTAGVEVTL